MTRIKAFITRHPLPTYFAVTFAISWGGVLLVVGPDGFQGTTVQSDPLFPIAVLAMLAGPAVAGILLTRLVYGSAGISDLLSRLRKWRVGARWYAVALLSAPLLFMAVLLPLSLVSPVFLPGMLTTGDRASLLLFGIAVGLVVGFFEELGWTGFAVPRLKLHYGVLATGVIVGVMWGAWHFLTNVLLASGTAAGQLSLPAYLTARGVGLLIGALPAFRVLMVWVYDRTGSLLVAMLMHVSLTASTLILGPLVISGVDLLISDLVLSISWWVVVAAVIAAGRDQLSRQPLRKQAA